MNRRTLLATIAAGVSTLAGCTTPSFLGRSSAARSSATASPPESSGQHPTQTTDSDPVSIPDFDSTSLVELGTADRTYAFTPTEYLVLEDRRFATWFTGTATADRPATITSVLTNTAEETRAVELAGTTPFGRLVSDPPRPIGETESRAGADTALVFAPTAAHDLVEAPPEIERATDGYWRLAADELRTLPDRIRLGPGESVRGEYALVGRASGVGQGRPPGVYEFTPTEEFTVQVAVWPTSHPGPTAQSRFAGESIPRISEYLDPRWYHESGASTSTFLRPSSERVSLPSQIEFVLINRSGQVVEDGPWNLYKFSDGEWFRLGPFGRTQEHRPVFGGMSKTWTIRAANGSLAESEVNPETRSRETDLYPFLGGGLYAAVAGVGTENSYGALVRFDAPPVELVPTDDTVTERRGRVVIVTSRRWDEARSDADRKQARLVLARAGVADPRLLPEQVMQDHRRGLRNTLAFVEPGIDRVVLRTDKETAGHATEYSGNARLFQFAGRAYGIVADLVEPK